MPNIDTTAGATYSGSCVINEYMGIRNIFPTSGTITQLVLIKNGTYSGPVYIDFGIVNVANNKLLNVTNKYAGNSDGSWMTFSNLNIPFMAGQGLIYHPRDVNSYSSGKSGNGFYAVIGDVPLTVGMTISTAGYTYWGNITYRTSYFTLGSTISTPSNWTLDYGGRNIYTYNGSTYIHYIDGVLDTSQASSIASFFPMSQIYLAQHNPYICVQGVSIDATEALYRYRTGRIKNGTSQLLYLNPNEIDSNGTTRCLCGSGNYATLTGGQIRRVGI